MNAVARAFGALLLVPALGLAASEPADPSVVGDAGASAPADVRRWEYVVLVRTHPDATGAIGRAELAAFKAGGAVLADLCSDYSETHSDYRLLVRTRDEDAIHQVVRAVRATPGIAGATAVPLPETPTWSGSPSFMSSYMADDGRPSGNADRVLVRHDVVPVSDKRELLEAAEEITAPPSLGPEGSNGVGGFSLNVSELFARWKESRWRKREERMRTAPLEILPPETATAPANP